MKLKLNDLNFIGDLGSSKYHPPHFFEWDRTYNPPSNNIVVFTDLCLKFAKHKPYKDKYRVAWICEPKAINPLPYEYLEKNHSNFDLILNSNVDFLSKIPNGEFCHSGMSWIREEDFKIYPKNRLVSMIFSEKQQTEGHQLRHEIFRNKKNCMDFYGKGCGNPISYKLESLKGYRFQLAIENSISDYYFTEKILDCFLTGTIPIYFGCDLKKFFNTKGLISFKSHYELDSILYNIDSQLYENMFPYIQENFERAKQYVSQEDTIFEILKKKELI